ncbi:MAG: ATP-binding protein, partial [Tannerella sp.]|nr:ATP-binding protein [Tannerella sp.]
MITTNRKLPTGIQDFEKLRTGNYLYVDKTAYVYSLTRGGTPYFLGRPRRFGKSLLLSTLKAYFLGKKELFEGLAIAGLEKDWTKYPVLHFDLIDEISSLSDMEAVLHDALTKFERTYGSEASEQILSLRFKGVIQRAYEQTGKKVVVLIDEYDKPLLSTMDNPALNEEVRKALKGFYGVLKSSDAYLRFVMLTGVTKFSKVSVFSDLNQLVDISMNKQYAGICGISEEELLGNFEPELRALGKERNMTYEAVLAEMKRRYDGYHFAKESVGMYNPFSVLQTFFCLDFVNYWFQSGTPTFLARMVRNAGLDIRKFEGDIPISADSISDYRVELNDPTPLLYQTGYLTIKGYNAMFNEYLLGFPNEEVKYGFLNVLLPMYVARWTDGDFSIPQFAKDLWAGNVDGFMTRLRAFFASIPNELENKTEKHYQTIFHLLFTMMGQYVQSEVHTAVGNADAVVKTADTVFVFEFKLDENSTAEAALKQIDDKSYTIPYTAGNRKILKIGVEFDTQKR